MSRVGTPSYKRKLEQHRAPHKHTHRAKRSGMTSERHNRLMAIAAASANENRVPPLKDFLDDR
jgi:hypothetical protein